MLPPAVFHDIGLKVLFQLVDADECGCDFGVADMLVIAFAGFVVVTNGADIILNIGQAVLVVVQTGSDRRHDKPNDDFNETSIGEVFFVFDNKFCAHDGKYYITYRLMSKSPSLDYLNSGRYTARTTPQWVVGFSSSETYAPKHAPCVFFVGVAQAYPNYGGLGGGAERLAGFVSSRSANPAHVTTSCLAAARGEYIELTMRAAIMATTPIRTRSKYTYHTSRDLVSYASLTGSLVDCARYLAMSGEKDAQPHITDLLIIASRRTDKLLRILESAEVAR